MIKKTFAAISFAALTCLSTTTAFAASTTVAGFDGGSDDGFIGNAFFVPTGGNPGGNAHHAASLFFNDLRTGGVGEPANPSFLGDYSPFAEVTLGFDVKTFSLADFIGNQIVRTIGIRLVNRDIQGPDGDSGVFYDAGLIGLDPNPDWETRSVTFDPTSSTLPPGWIGFGDTDPNTFEPLLPPGVTFGDILAGVDEFAVTGAVPGFFFTDAFYDVRLDNISVLVPEPGAGVLLLTGLLAMSRRMFR